MGKQINSANKLENDTKKTNDSTNMKETRKIDDYFNFGNRKRNREEVQKSKENGALRTTNKINNQSYIVSQSSKDRVSDFRSKSTKLLKSY